MAFNQDLDLTTAERPDLVSDAFDALPTAVAVLDPNGLLVMANRAWHRATEDGADGLCRLRVGDHLSAVLDGGDDGPSPTEEYLLEGIGRVLQRRSERFDLHYKVAGPEGDRWFLLAAGAIAGDGIALTRIETTMHEMAHEALADLAFHDALTGLPNRTLVADRIGMALGRTNRSGAWTAVVFADLDGFKNVNDTLGHHAGDHVLVEVAQRLLTVIRSEDTCGRWGGDEFVLVLELPNAEAVEAVANRIGAAFDEPIAVAEDQTVTLRASLGVALARHLYPVDELLRLADDAMYTAKRDGSGLNVVTAGALAKQ